MNDKPLRLNISAPGLDFVMPYIRRELPQALPVGDDAVADRRIVIAADAATAAAAEGDIVLLCPNIVGTGMTGQPMALARAVARGRFYHIEGNEARLSTIHATDVARAVAASLHAPGRYTVTDLADPTWDSLAEALAHRLDQRRIYTLPRRWARLVMNSRLLETVTRDDLADGSEFARRFNFVPTPVTEYLKTHVYDDESL